MPRLQSLFPSDESLPDRLKAPTPDLERTSRAYINFVWLWKLRWAAAFGQLGTILVAHFGFRAELPLDRLLVLIAITIVTNLFFGWFFRRALHRGTLDRYGTDGEWLIGIATITDIVMITLMLQATGGPKNPFAIFYLVNLVLVAIVLPNRWAVGLAALAIAGYSSLFIWGQDLAFFEDPTRAHLVRRGLLSAFVLAAAIIVYFVIHVSGELENRERELEKARQRRAQVQRIEAMVTLAAGAAHELSTPLSTIAVVAKELERELEPHSDDSVVIEDVQLIRREVKRCRTILEQMSANSGEMVGESVSRSPVDEFLQGVLGPLHADSRWNLKSDPDLNGAEVEGPLNALRRAIRGLVKNALDASADSYVVEIEAQRVGDQLQIEVVDRGTGMSEETLARSEDPFFTTKDPGRGMGLGLFLTRSVIERLEGQLELHSTLGVGTRATVTLPLAESSA